MLQNLIKIALRNIKRQKAFSVLHILGLSLGLASCLIISFYILEELSYDKFHSNADRIYRINQTFIWGDEDALFGSTGPAVKQAILSEVPEFEAMTRVHTPSPQVVTYTRPNGNPVVFEEDNVLAVDSNFLEIFTFPLTKGNIHTVLDNPNQIVITQSTAKKYFGNSQAIGKQLQFEAAGKSGTFVVTGVAEDVPENSHIQFDILISMSSFPQVKEAGDSWMWTTFITFGLLREDATPEIVAAKVAQVPGKYLGPFLEKYRGITYQEFLESGEEWNLYIQPLLDIHLSGGKVYSRLNETGNVQTLYTMGIIGALILLISIINFINLSTARSTSRAKEVGIRKVIGSDKTTLIYQFLTESLAYVMIAMILAIFFVETTLPHFNYLTEKNISIDFLNPYLFFSLIVVVLIVGIVSGLYPAFYLSAFQPVQVLKGKVSQGLKGGTLRNILVMVQFTISIGLIACTLIVHQQVKFWENMDVGFERENKIIVENIERLGPLQETYKNEIQQYADIEHVSYTTDSPPFIFDFDNFSMSTGEEKNISVNYLLTDENFVPAMGLNVLYGRNFSKAFNEKNNALVSISLTKSFGFSDPREALNKYLEYGDQRFKIVGIINDFNANLSDELYPTAFLDKEAPIFSNPSKEYIISIKRKLNSGETESLLSNLENSWNTIGAKAPFEYSFIDKEYLQTFQGIIRTGKLMRGFSGLVILIACLGLIGLVTYIIEKRNKEIGIRKVLGASVSHILLLLGGNFGKLLGLSFLIASPLSYLVMKSWLQDFPMRISIPLVTFFTSGGIMLLMAVLAMSYQTIKASRINPVDYLKEE